MDKDPDAFGAALRRLGETGVVDARGVAVTARLLGLLCTGAPRDTHGRTVFSNPQFTGAVITGDGLFFNRFRVDRTLSVVFRGMADFRDVTFKGPISFSAEPFLGAANFSGATFEGPASFSSASFGGDVDFTKSTFKDQADFTKATFRRPGAKFEGATFGDRTSFEGASFGDRTSFEGATFGNEAKLGPLLVKGDVNVQRARFGTTPKIEIISRTVNGSGARFPRGVTMRLGWAEVVLDEVEFGGSSTITPSSRYSGFWGRDDWNLDEPFYGYEERVIQLRLEDFPKTLPPQLVQAMRSWRTSQPRLVSLAGADVAKLTVVGVDLRACRFTGAYHLDQLAIEGTYPLADPPGWQPLWGRVPVWHWTKRRVLAEEHKWRRRYELGVRRRGWYPAECRKDPLDRQEFEVNVVRPPGVKHRIRSVVRFVLRGRWKDRERAHELSQLYRSLRKGREDRKDEPGAADFYYGEMEMRRQATPPRGFERFLLTLYWLVSGYGLRASRSLGALLVVVFLAALVFDGHGFKPPERQCVVVEINDGRPVYQCRPSSADDGFWAALAYSAQSATAVLRGPGRPLTVPGEWTEVILRLLGPVLFGLAVLSLRGRVKR